MLGEEVVHVFRDIKTPSSGAEIRTDFAAVELPAKKRSDQEESPPTRSLNLTAARIGDVGFIGLDVNY